MANNVEWLVAGLGNPGPEYERTYHNLGFLAVERLALRNGLRFSRKEAQAVVGRGRVAARAVLAVKPQSYMNLSGPPVRMLLDKYGAAPDRLVVVYDELALPWGSLRVRPGGSAAGHHGVESVIQAMGTSDFARVRLGIHPGHPVSDGAEFVLSNVKRGQREELDEMLEQAAQAIEFIIAEGVEKAMARFNRRARGLDSEEE